MDAKSACIVDFGAGGHHSHFRALCAKALRQAGIERIALVAPDCRADDAEVDSRGELSLELLPGGGYATLWKNSRRAVCALESALAAHPECGTLVLPYAGLLSPSILLHPPKVPRGMKVVAIDMTVDGALPRSAFPSGFRNGLRRLVHRLCLSRMIARRWSLFLLGVEKCPEGTLPLLDPADGGIVASHRNEARHDPSKPLKLLVYGKASPRKGIALLERYLRAGNDDVRMTFAGEWDDGLEGSRRFFEAHSLAEVNAQRIGDEESARLFEGCDAVWLGYDHHYGSSGVLALAAAFGKPVLATPYGLIGMAAKRGYGCVVEDERSMKEAVSRLAEPGFYTECAAKIAEFGRGATDEAAVERLSAEMGK